MHTAVSPASALFFDSERNWVTSLLQLEGSTWAALTANGHLRLLDATSSMLSPNPVELHQNTFIQKWGPHELLAASGHQLSLHDVRQPQPAFILTGNGKPYSSFAVHSQRNQAAVGTELAQSEALVELWDIRGQKMQHTYREIHSDDVASLTFHQAPEAGHLLLSGSTDGLFSITDTNISDEDDAVLGVGQVGASVKTAVWLDPNNQVSPVYALTDMQTVSLFSSHEPELLHDYGDLRHSTSLTAPAGFATDYVIDFDGPSKLMLGSNSSGFLEVDTSRQEGWEVVRHYQGGHQSEEVIRCAVTSADSTYVLSGGEDGQIVSWSVNSGDQPAMELDQESTSNEPQSSKKTKGSKKHRFAPY